MVVATILTTAQGVQATNKDLFQQNCIQIDPTFPYYLNRSADSIAEEVSVNGFTQVAITGTSPDVLKDDLITALKKKGITVRCLYGPLNAYYTSIASKHLPSGWEKWKVKYVGEDPFPDITFFCPNDFEMRVWRKQEITNALLAHPGIDVFDIGEVFYFGNLDEKKGYACVCERCKEKFLIAYPEEKNMPDFENPKSIYYYKTNTELYRKWVDFRVNSAVDFQNDLVNGENGLRARCPQVKICTWSLACTTPAPDPVASMRELQASDGAAIVKICRPDSHCIQTNFPDWTQPNLPPDYVKGYKKFLDPIKIVASKLPVSVQTEIGSQLSMRRSIDWFWQFDATAKEVGFSQSMGYMYCLFSDIADSKPVLTKARLETDGKTITLIFNKRLDKMKSEDKAQYDIPGIQITDIKNDGNLVILTTNGVQPGMGIIVNKAFDDPSTRHFKEQLTKQNEAGPFKMKVTR